MVAKRFVAVVLSLALSIPLPGYAVTLPSGISPAQVEQFRRLPKAQQEALARQYGVDLSSLTSTPQAGRRLSLEEPVQQEPPLEELEKSAQEGTPEEDEGLKPFGYSLFASAPSTFAPVTDVPIPVDYVLGPGDVLRVQLFGQQNQFLELLVDRDGQIQFPQVGPISVAGQPFNTAREQLLQLVSEKFIGVTASVALGELRSMRVFVLGDVKAPGSYTVSSLSTITNALLASGGISLQGSLRNVEHRRNGKLLSSFDLYDLLLKGDTSKDSRLQPGDVIHIPPVGAQVGVQGEVRRPALYELKNGESVRDIIQMAGGVTDRAYVPQVSLSRIGESFSPTLKTLDLRKDGNLKVRSGDLLEVGAIGELRDGFVSLEGAVLRAGKVGHHDGLRVSDLLGAVSESLKDNADLAYAVIIREINEQRDIQVFSFSPLEALRYKGKEQDPALFSRDRVLIFSRLNEEGHPQKETGALKEIKEGSVLLQQALQNSVNEDEVEQDVSRGALLDPVLKRLRSQAAHGEPEKIIGINGAVRFPGEYPLSEGETVQSLIRAAGGLLEAASLEVVEISKVQTTQEGEATTVIRRLGEGEVYSDIFLEPRDVVHIKGVSGFAQRFNVQLEGEVKYPGTYTVAQGETLNDVLKRAGGLTALAYPEGAIFSRETLRRKELERLKEAEARLQRDLAGLGVQQANIRGGSLDDVSSLQKLLVQVQESQPVGRLVINLQEQLQGKALTPVLLEDGDRLVVPPLPQEVSVFGEVQFPTSHLVSRKLKVKDYVYSSGGVTKRADAKRIYVIRADGSVWTSRRKFLFFKSRYRPEPGDTVVVPMDIDRLNQLDLWSSVSQIFYQIALGAAAVRSF